MSMAFSYRFNSVYIFRTSAESVSETGEKGQLFDHTLPREPTARSRHSMGKLPKRGGEAMKALKQQLSKESVAGVLFTLPFTIGFLLFMIVPMGISLYYSFCDYDILSPPVFTGLKNFISMFQDETFFKTLKVTFFFAFVSVPLKLLFALIVAMLLLENSKMSGFYRAAYYLPSIIGGSVAVSILWKRMFAMDGVVNKLLGMVGIQTSFSWLGYQNSYMGPHIAGSLAVWFIHAYLPLILKTGSAVPVRGGGGGRRQRTGKIL
jgi:multiple sugar transport system permease protein